MENFTPFSSLLGGVLIGLSATLMLILHGRISGISGILFNALRPTTPAGERTWRLAFFAGLVGGGLLLMPLLPDRFVLGVDTSWMATAAAGLLVGWGTQLGGGCTSGHGVCGVSRFAPRSLVATATFMATGAITVLAVRLLGAAS